MKRFSATMLLWCATLSTANAQNAVRTTRFITRGPVALERAGG
jgi:hypothetical protein